METMEVQLGGWIVKLALLAQTDAIGTSLNLVVLPPSTPSPSQAEHHFIIPPPLPQQQAISLPTQPAQQMTDCDVKGSNELTLAELPAELLFHVLSFLSPFELSLVSRVSRSFNEVIRLDDAGLWKGLYRKYFGDLPPDQKVDISPGFLKWQGALRRAVKDLIAFEREHFSNILLWAAKRGHTRLIESLMRNEADRMDRAIREQNAEGDSRENLFLLLRKEIFFECVMHSKRDSVMLFLFNDASNTSPHCANRLWLDVNEGREKDGRTALAVAVENEDLHLATMLLENGALLEHQSRKWRAANGTRVMLAEEGLLHMAVNKENIPMTVLLLSYGADVNEVSRRFRNTPLHLAVKRENYELTQLLLEKGASVDMLHHSGFTALMFAVEKGLLNIVELLLEYNAKVDIADSRGTTAVQMAEEAQFHEIWELLDSKGL